MTIENMEREEKALEDLIDFIKKKGKRRHNTSLQRLS